MVRRHAPIDLKREVFSVFSEQVRREVSERGLSEDEVAADFDSWRKSKREAGSRQ